MNELPLGWATTKLEEIARHVTYGFTAKANPQKGDVKMLRITDIQNNRVDWSTVPYCSIRPEEKEQYLLQPGDIVFARTGATVGKSFLLDNNTPESVYASYLIRVRCAKASMARYLAHFFNSPAYWSQITEFSAGIGQPNVNGSKLKALQVPLAPLNEQRRIADSLDSLLAKIDSCREHLERVPLILNRFQESVLAAAVSGRLTADWRNQHEGIESAELAFTHVFSKRRAQSQCGRVRQTPPGEMVDPVFADRPRIVDTEGLPSLPGTWKYAFLPDIGFMNRGTSRHRPRNASHLYGGRFPFVQTGDVAQSRGRITSHQQTYSEAGLEQSRIWPTDTICITIAANIAESAILTYPACFPDSIVGFLADPELATPEYVEYFVRTARTDLAKYAPATAQANINIAILGDVIVPLPPLDEQREIGRRVGLLLNHSDLLDQRYLLARKSLENVIPSLLTKAFSGDLVPQDPTDEPASELLNRIKSSSVEETQSRLNRRNPKRTSTMNRLTKDSLKATIHALPGKSFTFEDLRREVPAEYEVLKELLFQLLDEKQPLVRQVFDKKEQSIRLERQTI